MRVNHWAEEAVVDAREFGRRVRRAAAAKYPKHLSEELAEAAGVSTSTVAKLFGAYPPMPTSRTAAALARALGWDVNETLGWLGYEPLSGDVHAEALAPVPSAADRLKAMLRVWCRLSRSEQDVLMEVAMLLGSRGVARPGMGVTIFDAGSGVSPTDPQCAAQGHG